MEEVRRMRPLLGTYVEVFARAADAAPAVDAAFAALALAQQRWSTQDPASELSRLNRDRQIAAGRDTLRLLRLARRMMTASSGAFDCTLGSGSVQDIVIGSDRVRLERHAQLSLDGIAKGYAVDLAISALRRAGAASGWVNAGGDLRVFGDARLPVVRRELDGSMRPLGVINNAALASSRVNDEADDFPALIVGAPHKGVHSVMARFAWRADALTKVAANTARADRANAVARLGGMLMEMQ